MKKLLDSLKKDLKNLAAQIRKEKEVYRQSSAVHSLKGEFRAKHIIRCLLKGRNIEQIENHRSINHDYYTNCTESYLKYKIKELWKEYTGLSFASYSDIQTYGNNKREEKLERVVGKGVESGEAMCAN